MGYCIFDKDKSLDQQLNIRGWQSLFTLALYFGWEPQGTILMSWKDNKTGEKFPPVCFDPDKYKDGEWVHDDDWDGTYFSNDWQEITADDGQNLAEALEQALEHMSDKTEDQIEDDIKNWSGLDAQEVVKDCINLFKSGSCLIA